MDSSKKEDCKYWEKCYQKNEHHRQKYNHPPPESAKVGQPSSADADVEMKNNNTDVIKEPPKELKDEPNTEELDIKPETDNSESDTAKDKDENSKKRKSSENLEENEIHAKKINTHRLWQSSDEDYNELLKSNKFIHAKFLVKMPKDFYQFWDYAKTLGIAPNKNPFRKFSLELVGPYDFLAGRFAGVEQKNPGEYLRHWRFFYDPPEFQTIFVKKGTGVHYGYWRDDPKDEENLLIARNDAGKGCEFEFIATNMFDALAYFLEKDFAPTPFNQADLSLVRKALNDFVSGRKIERSPLYFAKTNRWKTIASKTFHGAGIIVPVDKKSTIGYRPLIESDSNLKKILSMLEEVEDPEAAKEKVMEKLGPIITAAVIALDECDFGTNLELGMDLFSSGHPQLHATIQSLLVPAYTLLERPQFLAILKAHLDNRKKTFDLSILN